MSTTTLRVDPAPSDRSPEKCPQQDLARRVRIYLHTQSHPDAHRLAVEVANDVVVVRGHVASESARELASNCCRRVAGVRQVVNETTVSSNSTVA
jgi:osmotically-inducible protein OsmY